MDTGRSVRGRRDICRKAYVSLREWAISWKRLIIKLVTVAGRLATVAIVVDAFCRRRYVLLEGSRKLRHWLAVILASCVDNFWYYM